MAKITLPAETITAKHRSVPDPTFEGPKDKAPQIPAGGSTTGRGIAIDWQDGPLVFEGKRVQPNGAFVEDVILAAKDRLEHYQTTKFACQANERAIDHLRLALAELEARTIVRQKRGVEGTHIP